MRQKETERERNRKGKKTERKRERSSTVLEGESAISFRTKIGYEYLEGREKGINDAPLCCELCKKR